MDKTGDKRKGRALSLGFVARRIKQPSFGGEPDFIIIINLEGGLRHTAFFDGLHIVIPFVDPLICGLPIGGPCKIGRINIGGHTVLKPMHLIGSNEMHFARKAGLIAKRCEVMRKGWHRGFEFRRIVIGCNPADQLPRHEGKPRRCAKR